MEDLLAYLFGLERFGIKMGLDVIKDVMARMDNPQEKFKSVQITGTTGKGSTAAFLASILQEAGYKVGMYTSPHLKKFNERIQINGVAVTDDEIISLTKRVKENVEGIDVTFFEFTTAMAFSHFAQHKVDIAIVEVGLGGRLDSTSILKPDVSIITNVSLDHTHLLGETTLEIAKDKAAIIGLNAITITAEKHSEIVDHFKKVCSERKSELLQVHTALEIKEISSSLHTQTFSTTGLVNGTFKTRMLGRHQIENACTALLAAYVLKISDEVMVKGIAKTYWPGRLDLISEDPFIMVDGAHNVAGVEAIYDFVASLPKRKVLLLGIAQDKDIPAIVKTIVPLFEEVIISQGNYKPAETAIIASEVRKYTDKVEEIPSLKEAVKVAKERAGSDGLFITGSLYMVGDAMKSLE